MLRISFISQKLFVDLILPHIPEQGMLLSVSNIFDPGLSQEDQAYWLALFLTVVTSVGAFGVLASTLCAIPALNALLPTIGLLPVLTETENLAVNNYFSYTVFIMFFSAAVLVPVIHKSGLVSKIERNRNNQILV